MSPEELDAAISELELRLERLRSLYEQYFLGIEKMAPAVARKDVDRRIWELRRQKIRNTAKRFKLQTVIQRYNTFQQYWQRICREIENGTYRRHVLRAERSSAAATTADPSPASSVPPAATPQADDTQSADLAELLESGANLDQELARALDAATSAVAAPRTPAAARRPLETIDLDIAGISERKGAPPTTNSVRPAARPSRPSRERPAEAPSRPRTSPPNRPKPAPPSRPRTAPPPRPRLAPPPRPSQESRTQAQPPKPTPTRPAAPPTKPRAVPGQSQLSDARVQELHQRLREAKERTREANKVSVNGLAKSLRAAETKLRAQYKNRNVDFDVVIKNGRAIVKPVVR